MFPELDGEATPDTRVRRHATPNPAAPAPSAPPNSAPAVVRTLDRWSDAVKNAILDRPGPDEESEFSAPEEDQPLGPLDRERFNTELGQRFAAVAEHIADTVAIPPTDFELAKREEEVGRFLHEFRWDALTLALDLRAGALPDTAAPSDRNRAPANPARHSDAWARKYRRMRALGP
jgi:hypothetical protein